MSAKDGTGPMIGETSLCQIKSALRAEMRARRAAISADQRAAAAEAVIGQIAQCLEGIGTGAIIAGFMPIGEELSPLPLMQALFDKGHPLALPVMFGKSEPLQFRAYSPGDRLASAVWGIREPLPEKEVVLPDVVLCALLAFDKKGFRLGYGGGYYDRTIRALRTVKSACRLIGLGYDEQRLDAVPVSDYDERVDWILTPSGARRAVT